MCIRDSKYLFNEALRRQFDAEDIRKLKKQGKIKGQIKIATTMLKWGKDSIEEIAKLTDLPVDTILQLKKSMNQKIKSG